MSAFTDCLMGADPAPDKSQHDPLIWTPAMIHAELTQVDTVTQALAKDIEAQKDTLKWSAERMNGWRDYLAEWNGFYKANKDSWFGGMVDVGRRFAKRTDAWRELMERTGGRPSVPPFVWPDKPKESWTMPEWGKAGLVVLGLVGVGFAGYYFTR